MSQLANLRNFASSEERGPLGGRPGEICRNCRWLAGERDLFGAGSRKKDTCARLGGREVEPTDFCTDYEAPSARSDR